MKIIHFIIFVADPGSRIGSSYFYRGFGFPDPLILSQIYRGSGFSPWAQQIVRN
jgi:hypothetical protein